MAVDPPTVVLAAAALRADFSTSALQDLYAPENRCFGCGPANPKGLRLKSRVEGELVVADFSPEDHHQTLEGILNGGIIGTLLDCHSEWAAVYALMNAAGSNSRPSIVTANLNLKFTAVTPMDAPVRLVARPLKSTADLCWVQAELLSDGKVTATCAGIFMAVKEGHPAYRRR